MLRVAIANRQKTLPVARALWRRMLRSATPPEWERAQLSVAVVGEAETVELNRRFTGRAGDTDVLAFPLVERAVSAAPCAPPSALDRDKASSTGTSRRGQAVPPLVVGEIIVCASRAVAEARARDVPPEEELALYVAHGFLHLLGYDDHTPGDRRRMYEAEEMLLKNAGVPYVRNRPRRRRGIVCAVPARRGVACYAPAMPCAFRVTAHALRRRAGSSAGKKERE